MFSALAGLSRQGIRAQNIISSLISAGYSKNKTLQTIRDVGLGYRNQVFLKDYDILANAISKVYQLKYIRKQYMPDLNKIPEYQDPRQYNLKFTVYFKMFNPETQQTFDFYSNVFSNVNMTRSQIEEIAKNDVMSRVPSLQIQQYYLNSAQRNKFEYWIE